jgi:hypothetical protein
MLEKVTWITKAAFDNKCFFFGSIILLVYFIIIWLVKK